MIGFLPRQRLRSARRLPFCRNITAEGGSCQEYRGIMFLLAITVALIHRKDDPKIPGGEKGLRRIINNLRSTRWKRARRFLYAACPQHILLFAEEQKMVYSRSRSLYSIIQYFQSWVLYLNITVLWSRPSGDNKASVPERESRRNLMPRKALDMRRP